MLRLKGREKQFVTLGAAVVDRFCGLVAPSGASVDDQTNRDDKIITKMFTPKKKS
jgi:translation initiation factor IF-3